ncbi:MAG: undecaprenyl-diphosphate phosphatase [Planctomycetes bacterium]|nr:undecaprenyl-diphosphate phosphatase [Planctomycetota bacterium]
MTLFQLCFLAIVQGLTEFLPISSSGHLVLARALLGIELENGLALDIALHAGTLLAVIAIYRSDVLALILAAFRLPGSWWRGRELSDAERLLAAVFVGTLPAAVVGLSAKDWIAEHFETVGPVGLALLGSSLWLGYAGRRGGGTREEVTLRMALLIGLAQCIALLPGASRSGWTIAAGLLLGLRAERAARFSFLLSLPTIGGAVLLEGRHVLDGSAPIGLTTGELLLGVLIAGLSGLLAWRGLLLVLRRGSLAWFGAYCACAGLLAISLAW